MLLLVKMMILILTLLYDKSEPTTTMMDFRVVRRYDPDMILVSSQISCLVHTSMMHQNDHTIILAANLYGVQTFVLVLVLVYTSTAVQVQQYEYNSNTRTGTGTSTRTSQYDSPNLNLACGRRPDTNLSSDTKQQSTGTAVLLYW